MEYLPMHRVMIGAAQSAAVFALLGVTGVASAQTAVTDASDDIVVTAQRRVERLQDVPIAITTVSSEALSNRGVNDAADLRGTVPSLSITSGAGVNASNLVSVRGISGQPLPIGAGQATGIYLDGVYLSRPDSAFFVLDDVERIEVLRGPQGTLYGRNTTAGAINIITRSPGDTLRVGADVSYGNFNSVTAKGSISGPIAGNLSAGLSGSYDRHDGYFTNTVTGNRLGEATGFTLRGKLRYQSSDNAFEAILSGDFSRNTGIPVFKNVYASALPGAAYTGIGDPKTVSWDAETESKATGGYIRTNGGSLMMNFKASNRVNFTSITSLRTTTAFTAYDGDGSLTPAAVAIAKNFSRAFNQEVRALITGSDFRLTIGGNYFRESATWLGSGLPPSLPRFSAFQKVTTDVDAYAAFGQLEFDVTEQFTLVGGLRFNREERDFTTDYSKNLPVGLIVSGSVKDSAFIPSAGVNFKAAKDILLYAKVSKGYQAPGFNVAPGAFVPTPNIFKSEDLLAYEAGVKSQFLDRRVTLNVAGFWYDYKDIQVRSVTGLGITTVDNAASATLKGLEAELSVQIAPGVSLTAHATLSESGYNSYCQVMSPGAPQGGDPLCTPAGGLANSGANRIGNKLLLAPDWSGGVSLSVVQPIGKNQISFNTSYSWESNTYFTTTNEPEVSTGGWHRLDARLGFKLAGGPEIYVYGKNITDHRYTGIGGRASPTIVTLTLNEPRRYGIGARFRF